MPACKKIAIRILSSSVLLFAFFAYTNQRGINGLPEVLQGYRDWQQITEPWEDLDIQSPHRGTKRLFTNLADAKVSYLGGSEYPEGSILLLEITQPGGSYPSAVAYMHKYSQSGTTSPNWHFELYSKNDENLPYAFFNVPAAACRACHARAPNDFVFRRGQNLVNP